MDIYQFAIIKPHEIEGLLKTSLTNGLSENEAKRRLLNNGLNKIIKRKNLVLQILLNQLKSPFVYLLLFASLTSYFLHNTIDAIIIFSIVLINTLIGFFQEYHAQKTLEFLKKQFKEEVIVLREKNQILINTQTLVPGDLIYLQVGEYVPADIRLMMAHNLLVDESSLSGESKSILKTDATQLKKPQNIYDAQNLIFYGTSIVSGNCWGIVINTASKTVYGNINLIAEQTFHQSKFQQDISKLSKFLLSLMFITIIAIFTLHFFLNPNSNVIKLILFCIAIAVGIIPEALPLVTNFAMSMGVLQLAKHNVLVKRLSAIEDLGSINVLCTDKTGTLTENKMTVKNLYIYKEEELESLAYLAASFLKTKDPIDIALQELKKNNNDYHELNNYVVIFEYPFEHKKLTSAVLLKNKHKDEYLYILKGVAEVILKNCKKITHSELEDAMNWISTQGIEGKRTLAVGYKRFQTLPVDIENEKNLNFAGIISFEDPLKADIYETMLKAKKLGIRFIMLTGDSKEVAFAIAHKLEMLTNLNEVITGEEFEKLNLEQQLKAINKCNAFARVTPEVKYNIINILKKDKFVGFLADGINDVLALKSAHVAIVVSQSHYIAKEAADIIILKKSLKVIVDGIIQGRKTFANTIKYIKISITSSLGNFYSIALISLLIKYLPLLPIQLLLVNILSDLPMIALANDNVNVEELKRPVNYNIKSLALFCSFFGIISSLFDFLTFSIFFPKGEKVLQTNWFLETLLTELIIIFSLRTSLPFYKAHYPSKFLIFIALICAIVTLYLPFTNFGHTFFKFVSPTFNNILIVSLLVISYFIVTEINKKIYTQFLNNK